MRRRALACCTIEVHPMAGEQLGARGHVIGKEAHNNERVQQGERHHVPRDCSKACKLAQKRKRTGHVSSGERHERLTTA